MGFHDSFLYHAGVGGATVVMGESGAPTTDQTLSLWLPWLGAGSGKEDRVWQDSESRGKGVMYIYIYKIFFVKVLFEFMKNPWPQSFLKVMLCCQIEALLAREAGLDVLSVGPLYTVFTNTSCIERTASSGGRMCEKQGDTAPGSKGVECQSGEKSGSDGGQSQVLRWGTLLRLGPSPAYPVALRVTSWMSPPKRSYHREILLSLPDQDSVF